MIEFVAYFQIINLVILLGMMKGLERIENKIDEVEE